MTNKFRTLVAVAATALLVPASANATTFSGRVTSFSPTSITVMDKEMVTVGVNDNPLHQANHAETVAAEYRRSPRRPCV